MFYIYYLLQLENYGLVTAWTVLGNNMSFILKTDLEHITCFMSGILQGQYWINNGLFVTRVQCIYYSYISKFNIL